MSASKTQIMRKLEGRNEECELRWQVFAIVAKAVGIRLIRDAFPLTCVPRLGATKVRCR